MNSRVVSKHGAARHRGSRRRRLGALVAAITATVAVAAATVGVEPQVWSGGAQASQGTSSLEQASLAALSEPVSDAMATQNAAKDLQLDAKKVDDVRESDALPADSGKGRRIVFSDAAQRVWLVARSGDVKRTYLVSGSKYDNLNPGTYSVQSKTRYARAFDDSGSMEYFVQFATGYTAPIGFHTVPVDNTGQPEQSKEQLGTPMSAGCVRQWRDDAVALWTFASMGTKVVVTA